MPTSELPAADVNEPHEPSKPNGPPQASPADSPRAGLEQEGSVLVEEVGEAAPPVVSGSRWLDYNTHELLEMISELEDERRWADCARARCGQFWRTLQSCWRCSFCRGTL
jgi:hypothetical protein